MSGTVCIVFLQLNCFYYVVSSYPLVNYPLPGNAPLQFVTPVENYSIPLARVLTRSGEVDLAETDLKKPRWVWILYLLLLVLKSFFSISKVEF